MSRKIYAALTEHFIRRMRNWALTDAGCAGESRVISSIYGGKTWGTYGDGSTPVLVGEAEDVGNPLAALPARYKQLCRSSGNMRVVLLSGSLGDAG